MATSERLASVCVPLWELRRGFRSDRPLWWSPDLVAEFDSALVERVLASFDRFAVDWLALSVGEGLTLAWPDEVRSDPRHPVSSDKRRPERTRTARSEPARSPASTRPSRHRS